MKRAMLFLALTGLCGAQLPTGIIAGVVRDPSGTAVSGVWVKAVSRATGLVRTASSSEQGDYSFPALLADEYDVSVEARGFERMIRAVAVEVGATTTADFTLRVGEMSESVTVDGAAPQIRYDSHSVGGLATHGEIQDLPLNGRGFLELAKLEPGVQPPSRGSHNLTRVPVLGAPIAQPGRGTRVTVDGGSVMAVAGGGSAMGFSQEVVQEFQTATVNFDLSTGLTFSGAVNTVTRSGSNDLHGTAFYFFRDHKLAAYPALRRDPANPAPFFQRHQFGFALGGPIRHDRVFFFGNWERNEQRGVVASTLVVPDFAHFSRITASPLFGDQFSVRLDGRISSVHTAFVRYSHDGSRAFSPSGLFAPISNPAYAAYPSQWTRQQAWADQSILGLTSVFRATLVNDLRFSYFFISSSELSPAEQDCPGCLGIGAPTINIPQADLFLGNSAISTNLGRRFHLHDSVTWQRGMHRARFGTDWEHLRGGILQWLSEPATLTLFSPQQARQNNIPVPAAFRTLDDILQLPLQTVTVEVGDPRVPQEDGGLVRNWNTVRPYFHDVWRLHPRLTINYGLSWSIDGNLNYDLSKPALLAPILGPDGLGPTRKQWNNFSPVVGFAWEPRHESKTVIRSGAGIFYESPFPPNLDGERAALGPPGLGRQTFAGTSILNTLPGIPSVPIGTALNFLNMPTPFTGAHLLSILPAVRAGFLQSLRNPDPSVRAVQLTKQVTAQTGGLFPADYPSPSALHANLGLQREIAPAFVVSADFVYLVFFRENALMAQPFDARKLELTGEAAPVAESVALLAGRFANAAVSSTGVLLYRALSGFGALPAQLAWFERGGKPPHPVSTPARYLNFRLSPDGTRAAVPINEQGNVVDLWIVDLGKGLERRLTSGKAEHRYPVWSPDGTRIVFGSNREGALDLYWKPSNGAANEELLLKSSEDKIPLDWSRDGKYLLYMVQDPKTGGDLWCLRMAEAERKPVRYLAAEPLTGQAQFSPDGRFVAYTSVETGTNEVYVRTFPDPVGWWQVSKNGGAQPRWRRDGKELFYLTGGIRITAVDVSTGATFQAGDPKTLFDVRVLGASYDVSADGRRFLALTNPTEIAGDSITVVLNWQAGLKK
jgi:hypothetical protein